MSVDFRVVDPKSGAELESMNVSNNSASKILTASGVEFDYCGTITVDQPRHGAQVLGGDLADFFTEERFEAHTFHPTNVVGAKIVNMGYSRERLAHYASRLLVLADAAEYANTYITFS